MSIPEGQLCSTCDELADYDEDEGRTLWNPTLDEAQRAGLTCECFVFYHCRKCWGLDGRESLEAHIPVCERRKNAPPPEEGPAHEVEVVEW